MVTIESSEATVGQAMHLGLVSCSTETPLRAVARVMATHRVHCVVVFDHGTEADEARLLWGIVSDRDVASAVAAGEMEGLTAGTVAAEPLVTVEPGELLARAAQLMVENAISHLVVVDPVSERPVGVVSTLDLARAVAGIS